MRRYAMSLLAVLAMAFPLCGQTLFQDDFSDGYSGAWQTFAPGWSEASGVFRSTNTSANVPIEAVYSLGGAWTDYTVSVDVKPDYFVVTSATGVLFRLTERSMLPTSSFAECSLHRNADGGFLRMYAQVGTSLQEVMTPFSAAAGTWYRIRATARGTTLGCMVEGYPSTYIELKNTLVQPFGTIGLRSTHIPSDFDNISVVAADQAEDFGSSSSLRLMGGTIAGQTVNPSNRTVTVAPGASLSGSFQVAINSTYPSNAVMAMGVTPTWGSHSSSYSDLGGFLTPGSYTRTVNVNYTAPTTPGTYYIIAAFRGEFTAAQVMSCTNWTVSSPLWNNGDDIADWSAAAINTANQGGTAPVRYLYDSGNHDTYVPATAIRVVVSGPPSVCIPSSSTACLLNGRFKATLRYRSAFDDLPADSSAFVKPVTGFASANYETAFFYFNNPNNIELLLKVLDQGNTDSLSRPTVAVIFGTATPLHVELTITDTTTGVSRQYGSDFGEMRGATDFTAFLK